MDLRCTCGASPPADARFCHKCGRPLRESSTDASDTPDAAPEYMAVVPPPLPPPSAAPAKAEIGFSDSLALRVCLLAAAISSFSLNLVGLIPGPFQGFGVIALLGLSGVLAVVLYRRRSGGPVSILGGARLGWITGAFCFVIGLVLFTLDVVVSDGRNVASMMQQVAQQASAQSVDPAIKRSLANGEAMVAFGIVWILVVFVTMSMMASVGGALGAKYFGQRQSS